MSGNQFLPQDQFASFAFPRDLRRPPAAHVTVAQIEAAGAVPPPPRNNESLRRRRREGKKLMVDWPACKAHGLCHELLPERIDLDEWGYPIIDRKVLRGRELDEAKKAVTACPTLALRLLDSAG